MRPLPTEATLNNILAEELLREDQRFARWLLAQTRFAGEDALCVQTRADNPWSRVKLQVWSEQDGSMTEIRRDAETDVLAIYRTSGNCRIALHIENKLASSVFTLHQAKSYQARLTQWRNRPKLGMYIDATSILSAPQRFFDRNQTESQLFELFVSHEAVAQYLPSFAPCSAA